MDVAGELTRITIYTAKKKRKTQRVQEQEDGTRWNCLVLYVI